MASVCDHLRSTVKYDRSTEILQTYYLLLNDTERISIDFRKTNTKFFTTTSQRKGNYRNEPIGIQRTNKQTSCSAEKRDQPGRYRF